MKSELAIGSSTFTYLGNSVQRHHRPFGVDHITLVNNAINYSVTWEDAMGLNFGTTRPTVS